MTVPLRLAINGFGRIGRCFLRALQESSLREKLSIVAINEIADLESMAYLTRFDSTHGRFSGKVEVKGDHLCIDNHIIQVSHAKTPEDVDWRGLGIDILIEASGSYVSRQELDAFLAAGCPRLLLSHPGRDSTAVDRTIIFGTNHETLSGDEQLVSAGSCTTNAVVPVLAILDAKFGVEHAMITTLHSVMNDQPLVDCYHHSDLCRTRSAMQSMIPVETGLARGVIRLLPQLANRVEAKSIRVPVPSVSGIDLVVHLARATTASEINYRLRVAAGDGSPNQLAYTENPQASIDFNHSLCSAVVDGSQTKVSGPRLASVLIWFDNEWGFANRMLELADFWGQRLNRTASKGSS